ncbi:hypothetical protein [Brevibacillus brevis]|uniref:hypothetical protein n=1 Tax=Brevibacillus brevis TaxID=1393 RepID=UPI001EE2A7AB|nr:hypothetical protein [Brevibacillus brevis]
MLKFQLSLISLSRSEEVELREVVQEVTESMSATFARAQVNFHFKGDHAVWIKGDRQRLAQIVVNLLTNACKHTPGARASTKRTSLTCLSVFIGEVVASKGTTITILFPPRAYEGET